MRNWKFFNFNKALWLARPDRHLKEGDIGVCSNAVLGNFSKCGIAVLLRPSVRGFEAFWSTVFGKKKYFPGIPVSGHF